jgi:hypothetical protein
VRSRSISPRTSLMHSFIFEVLARWPQAAILQHTGQPCPMRGGRLLGWARAVRRDGFDGPRWVRGSGHGLAKRKCRRPARCGTRIVLAGNPYEVNIDIIKAKQSDRCEQQLA